MAAPNPPLIRWLPPMKKVLWALTPAMAASVYFFGWRSLVLLAVTTLSAFLAEYLFARHYKEPVNSSVFVTGVLLALTLPPTLPFWMAAVGAVFGVVFGKMAFGGFGKNPFNPALVGRAFIYITFAGYMTSMWVLPAHGPAGGLTTYSPDAVTSATVLTHHAGISAKFYLNAFLGNIPGSLGETSALALLLGGLWLFWKRVANRTIIITTLLGMVAMQAALWGAGVSRAVDPLTATLAGGFMLGLFFMATDPVTAPKQQLSKIIVGLFIGIMTSLIRTFSVWPEGMMFAILLANMFTPITDYAVSEHIKKKKLKAQAAAGGA
ncbi:RnfABCDGE type electron transport complex subunit D [Myxococcota bacterium]|nr:RnfABCDGE type electron transport complex subunit D [Myxococcota bacterium]MBU1534203.1 RnfABCDGE type electron transport complex subunit D [Myxococcota bacterium]